jgi:hypothetical protein
VTTDWQELETVLAAAYAEEARLYGQALALAEQLGPNLPEAEPTRETLRQMDAVLSQTAAVDATIAASRQQWVESGRRPGPAMAEALQQVAGLIERLQARVGAVEQVAKAHRDRLFPELERLARGRQMQRAYAAARAAND